MDFSKYLIIIITIGFIYIVGVARPRNARNSIDLSELICGAYAQLDRN